MKNPYDYKYTIEFWEEDVNGNDVLITAYAYHHGFRKGDRDRSGGQLEPDEDEWLEVVNMLFNGEYLDEKATEALLGYDWDVLENKIQIKFYEQEH
jgi:hypothetical protein